MFLSVLTGLLPFARTQTDMVTAIQTRLFNSAHRAYQDGFYDRAEESLKELRDRFPKAAIMPRVQLLWAQTRYKRGDYMDALKILSQFENRAGDLADFYLFWTAKAWFALEEYENAAGGYAQLLKNYPESSLYLSASYHEALSRFQMGQYPEVIALLQDKGSPFVEASRDHKDDILVTQGLLLLAQALLEQREHKSAMKVLDRVEKRDLNYEHSWQLEFLRARVHDVAGQTDRALQLIPDLKARAGLTRDMRNVATTNALQAKLLEKLNRIEDAAFAYEENLAPEIPAEYRRVALLQIIKLRRQYDQVEPAISHLEKFLVEKPDDQLLDLVHLTLGELYTKEYFLQLNQPEEDATFPAEFLKKAEEQFQSLVEEFPQSSLRGQAHLQLGRCYLEENRLDEAQRAYEAAIGHLDDDQDQVLARFKLAEIEFRKKNYDAAESGFRSLLEEYRDKMDLAEEIFAKARYNIVRIALEQGQPERALDDVSEFESHYPLAPELIQARLLVCQYLSESGHTAEARVQLQRMLREYPDAKIIPEIRLALAQTYVEDKNWTPALREYEWWIADFPHHPKLPDVKFDFAWATYQSGNEKQAVELFNQFIREYPNDSKSAEAQMQIGDYYLSSSQFVKAESCFQKVYEQWPQSGLRYQAKMLAGIAAVGRQGYSDAREHYFQPIFDQGRHINPNSDVPDDLVVEAFFAQADTLVMEEPLMEESRQRGQIQDAINTLEWIGHNYPKHPLVPVAKARMAELYFQLGVENPARYENAIQLYREVLGYENISPLVRCKTRVGLALALEKQAETLDGAARRDRLNEALAQLEAAFYPDDLNGGEPDPFWISKAGLELARLGTSMGMYEQAARVYQRMIKNFPALQPELEQRLDEVQKLQTQG